MSSVSLFLLALGLFAALLKTHLELTQLKQKMHKYSTLPSKEEFEQQLDSNIYLKEHELSELEEQSQSLKAQIEKLQQQLRGLDAKVYLQSLDSYDPYYNFIHSEDYLIQLKNNKNEQTLMQESRKAYVCHAEWIIGESKKEGKKMSKNLLELIKLAFENQCKSILQDARCNNISSLEKKMLNVFEKINGLSSVTRCEISREYLDLRIRELHLRCELEEKKQKEKAQEQERQKEKKEMEKERRASEKARREIEVAEERERLHQEELKKIRQEIQKVEGEERRKLEFQFEQLQQQIIKDQRDKEDAISRYGKVKDGHIYVVSNVGSFKEDSIYRIFVTKSENEDDYVRSMNPLVPFPFDIHFKIYSEEASETIRYFHQRFHDKRVNLDNERRDFFQVSLDEIEQVVKEFSQEKGGIRIVGYNRQSQNLEYFRTLSLKRKEQEK